MRKRIICLVLSLIMTVGLSAGCGKEEKVKKRGGKESYRVIDDKEVIEQYASEDYEIIGGIIRFGDSEEPEYLDDYETITLSIPDSVSEEDYDNLFGAYFGDGYTYLYVPDPEMLAQGKLQFETLHHTDFGQILATDELKIEKYVERAAVLGVTREITEGELKDSFRETLNNSLESLGIDADTYGGELFRYIMSHDPKGEALTAALDGDKETLAGKVSGSIADYLVGKTADGYGLGDLADLVKAAKDGDDPAQAAVNLVKEIEKKVFPEIDVVVKFAGAVDKGFDIWADDAINEIYEHGFRQDSDANGNIKNDDWRTLYEEMRGAAVRYESKGIDEATLRKRFEQRKANETVIAKRKEELNKQIEIWKERDLLHWNHNGYKRNMDLATRLNSLFAAKEYLRERYTVNGELNKGKLRLSEEEFLEAALEQWADTSKRDQFYDWEKENGLVKVKKTKGDYAWVLTDTFVWSLEAPAEDAVWPDYASASPGTHNLTSKFIDRNGNKSTYANFIATCQEPPHIIYAGDTVSLAVSIKCTRIGEMNFTGDAYVRWDPSGLVTGGTYGGPKYVSPEGYKNFQAYSQKGKTSEEAVVSMTIPAGSEGEKHSIYFEALRSNTEWQYEWRPVGE